MNLVLLKVFYAWRSVSGSANFCCPFLFFSRDESASFRSLNQFLELRSGTATLLPLPFFVIYSLFPVVSLTFCMSSEC